MQFILRTLDVQGGLKGKPLLRIIFESC